MRRMQHINICEDDELKLDEVVRSLYTIKISGGKRSVIHRYPFRTPKLSLTQLTIVVWRRTVKIDCRQII